MQAGRDALSRYPRTTYFTVPRALPSCYPADVNNAAKRGVEVRGVVSKSEAWCRSPKRGVEVYTGAKTAASKSEEPIRQGQTLFSVQLTPQAEVHNPSGRPAVGKLRPSFFG